MKKVVYRLKFRFQESFDKATTRSDRLNSILSSMEDIDTEKQLNPPLIGSIIEVDEESYKISSLSYSFLVENDIVFYTTIVNLVNISEIKQTKDYDNEQLMDKIKKMVDSKIDSKYISQKYTDISSRGMLG